MNEQRDGSLGLDEVTMRFAESEAVLRDASAHLSSLIDAEEQSQALAGALSSSATAVTEYSVSAKALLDEGQQALAGAREVLEAGSAMLSGTTLAELTEKTSELQEQASGIGNQVTKVSEALVRSTTEITQAITADGEKSRSAIQNARVSIDDFAKRGVTRGTLFAMTALVIVAQGAAAAAVIAVK